MGEHVTAPTEGHTMTKLMDVDKLLTGPEIAFLANETKMATFERWKLRNQGTEKVLPEPDWVFGLTPVWHLDETLLPWLEATNRKYDVKAWRKARDAGQFRRKSPSNAKVNR